MVVLALLAVVVIVAVVLVGRHQGSQPSPRIPPAPLSPGSAPTLAAAVEQWEAAGLISAEQASAIVAFEEGTARPAVAVGPGAVEEQTAAPPGAPRAGGGPPEPSHRHRVPVVAETLGYLGGTLATAGAGLIVSRSWPDASMVSKLAIVGVPAALLVVAGAAVDENRDPAFARLRGVLWLVATALAGVAASVVALDGLELERGEAVAVAVAGAVTGLSALLWANRARPLQQLTMLVAAVTTLNAGSQLWAPDLVGPVTWAAGAVLLVLGLQRRMREPALIEAVGAVAMVVGAFTTSWGSGVSLLVAAATGGLLLAIAGLPAVPTEHADRLVLVLVGGLAAVQAVPSAVGYYTVEADLGWAAGLVTWVIGAGVALLGDRHAVRWATAAVLLGCGALLVGAAVTAASWPTLGPVFTLVTALGLLALGVRPGRVPYSFTGSAGLLVSVPWTIATLFPGEGRVPLLLVATGLAIVGVAVATTHRRGGRPEVREPVR